MCNNAILPTTIKVENTQNDLVCLIYIFNKWLKLLTTYGKLDSTSLNKDFNVIHKVIKSANVSKDLRSCISSCRDYALAEAKNIAELCRCLRKTLKHLCSTQEDSTMQQVKSQYNDQGMIERFRPLSKRLEREDIHRINKRMAYTDMQTDSSATTKRVRRIVEKRAAQAVHRNTEKKDRETNRYRQYIRRATSFSLYNKSFIDYDASKRSSGTHWKVCYRHKCAGKKLKAKQSYNSLEEALMACHIYSKNHPEDSRRMAAYKCEHCNKWHIGHERFAQTSA